MLFAMFRRHIPAGNWVLPLVSGLTVLALAAVAVYVLSSVWRGGSGAGGLADSPGLSAGEILDRRLASGEITVAEYEQISQALGRSHAESAAAAAAASAGNGAAAAA